MCESASASIGAGGWSDAFKSLIYCIYTHNQYRCRNYTLSCILCPKSPRDTVWTSVWVCECVRNRQTNDDAIAHERTTKRIEI